MQAPSTLPREFTTARLVARMPESSDAGRLFTAYTQRLDVCRYMVWRPHRALAETEAFIADCIAAASSGTRLPYVLALADDPHRSIGMLDARFGTHAVDVGYVLAPGHWGRGLMPQAVGAFAALALATPSLYRVQASCDVENIASQRVLEKSGIAREGRHERFVVHPNVSAEPRPCFMSARFR